MKYLELHEGKPILSSVGKVFKKCLNTSSLPKKNYNKEQKNVEKVEETKTENEVSSEQAILRDVKECMDSMLQKVQEKTEEVVISLSDSDDDKNKEQCNYFLNCALQLFKNNLIAAKLEVVAETITKQTEMMDTDSEISNVAVAAEHKQEIIEKNVKEEKSIRV